MDACYDYESREKRAFFAFGKSALFYSDMVSQSAKSGCLATIAREKPYETYQISTFS
jgi:hypothetical protein